MDLDTFHWRRGHSHDHLAVWQAGLAAADHLSDTTTHTRAYRHLGRAHLIAGHLGEALDHLRRALVLAEQTGDLDNLGQIHRDLAWTWDKRGHTRQAVEHATVLAALPNPRDPGARG